MSIICIIDLTNFGKSVYSDTNESLEVEKVNYLLGVLSSRDSLYQGV